ncbi:hypothetical protein B6U93_00925 [Candidatus Woesearchaeota archaeon ex4484_78]|nr:MAG: hypothetical protein B6U93_00925 [Candidatus Woesearchaeota archaeon ex4484_78]
MKLFHPKKTKFVKNVKSLCDNELKRLNLIISSLTYLLNEGSIIRDYLKNIYSLLKNKEQRMFEEDKLLAYLQILFSGSFQGHLEYFLDSLRDLRDKLIEQRETFESNFKNLQRVSNSYIKGFPTNNFLKFYNKIKTILGELQKKVAECKGFVSSFKRIYNEHVLPVFDYITKLYGPRGSVAAPFKTGPSVSEKEELAKKYRKRKQAEKVSVPEIVEEASSLLNKINDEKARVKAVKRNVVSEINKSGLSEEEKKKFEARFEDFFNQYLGKINAVTSLEELSEWKKVFDKQVKEFKEEIEFPVPEIVEETEPGAVPVPKRKEISEKIVETQNTYKDTINRIFEDVKSFFHNFKKFFKGVEKTKLEKLFNDFKKLKDDSLSAIEEKTAIFEFNKIVNDFKNKKITFYNSVLELLIEELESINKETNFWFQLKDAKDLAEKLKLLKGVEGLSKERIKLFFLFYSELKDHITKYQNQVPKKIHKQFLEDSKKFLENFLQTYPLFRDFRPVKANQSNTFQTQTPLSEIKKSNLPPIPPSSPSS